MGKIVDLSYILNIANKRHNYLYDYSLIKNFQGVRKKYKIKCNKHGVFEKRMHSHIYDGRGCPNCAKEKRKTRKYSLKFILKKLYEKYGNEFDFSNVVNYNNNQDKLTITCNTCNETFIKSFNVVFNKNIKCIYCEQLNKVLYLIEESKKKHNNYYLYDVNLIMSFLKKSDFVLSKTKIPISCPLHGVFYQNLMLHLQGRKCIECVGNKKLSTTKWIQNILIKFPENYYLFDYSKVNYVSSHKKIKIICKKCKKTFLQLPYSHFSGQGCKYCKMSKGERKLLYWLEFYKIHYIHQKSFIGCKSKKGWKLRFDFYLPTKNILIEYQGKQHYEPSDYIVRKKFSEKNSIKEFKILKENDEIKKKYCLRNNITLIEIPYTQINKINSIIKKCLNI